MRLCAEHYELLFGNCLSWEQEGGWLRFRRFTDSQLALLEAEPFFKTRARCTAGVCLDVVTSSRTLRFSYRLLDGARPWAFFDLFLNGRLAASLGESSPPQGSGTFSYKVEETGRERNRLTIYLPHAAQAEISRLEVDDGASLEEPEKPRGSLLCLGDSITQGMDGLRPSSAFPVQVSRFLGLRLLNQGLGGHTFAPELLEGPFPYRPDLVMIAYGTNDWELSASLSAFQQRAEAYLRGALRLFPGAAISVLTPIWRQDHRERKTAGDLRAIARALVETCSGLPGLRAIDGFDLVPHLPSLFTDGLHPTDEGFAHYSLNLLKALGGLPSPG